MSKLRIDHPITEKKEFQIIKTPPKNGTGCVSINYTDNRKDLLNETKNRKQFEWKSSITLFLFSGEEPPAEQADSKKLLMRCEVDQKMKAHFDKATRITDSATDHLAIISQRQLIIALRALLSDTPYNTIPIASAGTEIEI